MSEQQSSETIWILPSQLSILENAERLLNDAQLLYENRRYARTVSLAILAFEEIGKVYLLGLEGAAAFATRKGSQHRDRQQQANGLLMIVPVLKELSVMLEEYKLPSDATATAAFMLAIFTAKDRAESLEDKRAYSQFEERILAAIVARLKATSAQRVAAEINSGRTNSLKQAGLYCDVDENGDVSSDPSNIGKETAREWLDRARFAVEFCAFNKPDHIKRVE